MKAHQKRFVIAVICILAGAALATMGGVTRSVTDQSTTLTVPSDSVPSDPHVDETTYLVKVAGSSTARRAATSELSEAAQSADGTVVKQLAGGWQVVRFPQDIDRAQAEEMLAVRGVAAVEPNIIFERFGIETAAPRYAEQWYLHQASDQDIDAPEAWASGAHGSANVKVAVLDSGVLTTHPDLVGSTVAPGAPNGNSAPTHWHGTAVAGLIAATGARGITGIAPNVKIIPVQIENAAGQITLVGAVGGIDHAVANGANIINMSWGGDSPSQALYDALLRANNAGVLLVAAAGNDAVNNDVTPHYPASYDLPMIMSVGAVNKAGALSDFSNYGALSVDVAASGGASAPRVASENVLSTVLNNTWNNVAGTSFAAPIVAGVAALTKSRYPASNMYSIRQHLLATGVASTTWAGKSVTGKVVNAANAVKVAPASIAQPVIPAPVVGGGGAGGGENEGGTPPASSGSATLSQPADGATVDGYYEGLSWDLESDWKVVNVQVVRADGTPSLGLLDSTPYGELFDRSGSYSSYHSYDGQLPTGRYHWRVVAIPEDSPGGQLVASPFRSFIVGADMRAYVSGGSLRVPRRRSRPAPINVSLSIRTNDEHVSVQAWLMRGRKRQWTSSRRTLATKPGTFVSTKITGTTKLKRGSGRYRMFVRVTSPSGATVTESASLY